MKQLNQSIRFMLTHSIVSISLVITVMIFFTVFHLTISPDQSSLKRIIGAITISITMSVFFGIYFGGALNKLKQNYLWNISRSFRQSLLGAFLISLIVLNMILATVLYQSLKHMPLIMVMPLCASVFSAYLVLGKNIFYKLLIPAIPIVLTQLYRVNLSFNTIFVLIIVATMALVFLMFIEKYNSGNSRAKTKSQKDKDLISFAATGLNNNTVVKLNSWIGDVVSSMILRKKANLDWAIIMPHHKLALFSLFYVLLVVISTKLISVEGKQLVEGFSILFLGSSFMNILMESRILFRQTRTISHVYGGINHGELKSRILRSLDKNLLLNSVVFISGIIILASALSIPFDLYKLLLSSAVITVVALSYYPILLCFKWINITVSLVLAVCVYVFLAYISLKGLKHSQENVSLSLYFAVLFIIGFGIRLFTQKVFKSISIDNLLKNK